MHIIILNQDVDNSDGIDGESKEGEGASNSAVKNSEEKMVRLHNYIHCLVPILLCSHTRYNYIYSLQLQCTTRLTWFIYRTKEKPLKRSSEGLQTNKRMAHVMKETEQYPM